MWSNTNIIAHATADISDECRQKLSKFNSKKCVCLKIAQGYSQEYLKKGYGTAQFKLDICTCVLVQSLEKFVTELTSFP